MDRSYTAPFQFYRALKMLLQYESNSPICANIHREFLNAVLLLSHTSIRCRAFKAEHLANGGFTYLLSHIRYGTDETGKAPHKYRLFIIS